MSAVSLRQMPNFDQRIPLLSKTSARLNAVLSFYIVNTDPKNKLKFRISKSFRFLIFSEIHRQNF